MTTTVNWRKLSREVASRQGQMTLTSSFCNVIKQKDHLIVNTNKKISPSSSLSFDPFIKWAGGKRRLVRKKLSAMMPIKFDTYYEPFVGAGAMVFYLLSNMNGHDYEIHISDTNIDLINTYITVRDHPDELISLLKQYESEFNTSKKIDEKAKKFYYDLRDAYNRNDNIGTLQNWL
jgi:D12 class N6 adenine-specific DNA methyltransferase